MGNRIGSPYESHNPELYDTIKYFLKHEYKVTAVCKGWRREQEISKIDGCTLYRIKSYKIPRLSGLSFLINGIFKVTNIIKENDFDIVHTNSPFSTLLAYYSMILARKKIPIITTFHGSWAYTFQFMSKNKIMGKLFYCIAKIIEKHSINKCKVVTSDSIHFKRFAKNNYNVDIIFFPNCEDINKFKFHVRKNKPKRLIYVGRLSPEKGVEILPKIAEKTRIELVVVGDGELRAIVQKKEHIKFIGAVPHSEVLEYLEKSDIFILPSKMEGTPRSVLEAMASGLIVIANDVGGLKDIISNGKDGFLVDGSLLSYTETINKIKNDDKLRILISKGARMKIEKKFNIKDRMNLFSSLYKKMIK